ncbi:hypothetical protein QFC22_005594 [Naganishia vaughanmartiniae]|uniref:Uncharacterized protein n=1 Tax=Naganishia vaughanmartiniae TaxID=1424756 RepID=A0ACC2WTA0_9TREE|nr:hypothetical protein QFC22_005594 [Naganishia vaughanmartiniae]
MSDIGSDDLEMYAERTGISLTLPPRDSAQTPSAPITQEEVVVVGESITLDLGTGSGAWDDSELVNAWDAAVEEFKLHNPGPGTWLDKATAALAVGKPLAGAQHGESNVIRTRWYTETPPAKPTYVNPYSNSGPGGPTSGPAYQGNGNSEAGSTRKKSTVRTNLKRKRKREELARAAETSGNATLDAKTGAGRDEADGSLDMELDEDDEQAQHEPVRSYVTESNPYAQAPLSPAYTPASPPLYASNPNPTTAPTPHGPSLPDRITRQRFPAQPTDGIPQNPYLPPRQQQQQQQQQQQTTTYHRQPAAQQSPLSAYAPSSSGLYPEMGASGGGIPVTKEEASTRAVNAQWWAGYWFAMSEVMPSVAQLEQTQSQLQR